MRGENNSTFEMLKMGERPKDRFVLMLKVDGI